MAKLKNEIKSNCYKYIFFYFALTAYYHRLHIINRCDNTKRKYLASHMRNMRPCHEYTNNMDKKASYSILYTFLAFCCTYLFIIFNLCNYRANTKNKIKYLLKYTYLYSQKTLFNI